MGHNEQPEQQQMLGTNNESTLSIEERLFRLEQQMIHMRAFLEPSIGRIATSGAGLNQFRNFRVPGGPMEAAEQRTAYVATDPFAEFTATTSFIVDAYGGVVQNFLKKGVEPHSRVQSTEGMLETYPVEIGQRSKQGIDVSGTQYIEALVDRSQAGFVHRHELNRLERVSAVELFLKRENVTSEDWLKLILRFSKSPTLPLHIQSVALNYPGALQKLGRKKGVPDPTHCPLLRTNYVSEKALPARVFLEQHVLIAANSEVGPADISNTWLTVSLGPDTPSISLEQIVHIIRENHYVHVEWAYEHEEGEQGSVEQQQGELHKNYHHDYENSLGKDSYELYLRQNCREASNSAGRDRLTLGEVNELAYGLLHLIP